MMVSIQQLSELTGIDRRKVRPRLSDAGLQAEPGPSNAMHYDSRAALSVLLCDAIRLDPSQERAKLDQARREQIEARLQAERGELLPADEVATVWADQVRIAKERLLSLPARVAPALLRLDEIRDVERVMRDALLSVLEELAGEGAK